MQEKAHPDMVVDIVIAAMCDRNVIATLTPVQQNAIEQLVAAYRVFRPRYIIAEPWEHLDTENKPYFLRWIYDRHKKTLVAVQYLQGNSWQSIERDTQHWCDVDAHIRIANDDALEDPEPYALEASNELPAWAQETAHGKTKTTSNATV